MLRQTITPARGVFFAGESITVELSGSGLPPGRAFFRTNLPGAALRRKELITAHEEEQDFRDLDWSDIEIPGTGNRRCVTLPLIEPGIFEGKCCFFPADGSPLIWAEGENFHFKVVSASAAAGSSYYACFVRLFGRNLFKAHSEKDPEQVAELEQRSFSVTPPSGTFRQVIRQLDHIFGTLNCTILQLLPIHPVPAAYGRMGRFGSPFAALDYFAVDPALGEFDPGATPMEQFEELVRAVHARGKKIFLDIPVNHTGWASKLQQEHPEYFVRTSTGQFESPGAWGVVWADLCKLDYSRKEVAMIMAKVLLTWCSRGVDGFRCDAGYMVPEKAWDYIIARVRSRFPDTTFLLEGLGGPPEVQERLLRYSGLDCGYSELFQNYSRGGIEHCLHVMQDSAARAGTLVSFAETHDNNRLAASGKLFARNRFLVCALLSVNGGFGFANGSEFLAAEKIDVHGDSALNYGAEDNLCGLISRLNTLLTTHPAFTGCSKIENVTRSAGEGMAVLRSDAQGGSRVLVLLNPDCGTGVTVAFPGSLPASGNDLLTGKKIDFRRRGDLLERDLQPGEGLAVALEHAVTENFLVRQEVALMEKRAFIALHSWQDEKLPAVHFTSSPERFAAELSGMTPPPLTIWNGEHDARRVVPLPAGDLLLISNPHPFRCIIRELGEGFISSVPMEDGTFGALLTPEENPLPRRRHLVLEVESYTPEGARTITGTLCQLPPIDRFSVRTQYSRKAVKADDTKVFGSNDSGSYALFPAAPGNFSSKYQALLAVNGDPDVPVDRRCLFTGLSIYLVAEGYSFKVDGDSLLTFTVPGENRALWKFRVPAGRGRWMDLEVEFRFALKGDAMELTFRRPPCTGIQDNTAAAIILRPEIEDRINHQITRACDGPEWELPAALTHDEKGFSGPHGLRIQVDRGSWHKAPEWHYMCDLPAERRYGLEDKTDRYSPGYFHVPLEQKEKFTLSGFVTPPEQCLWPDPAAQVPDQLTAAMRRFIVKRNDLSTVMAGYPWFLDWGRDTLIAVRGLLKAPEFREKCAAVIRAFAGFERRGTLPNVLLGTDDANRDTSDAPLYLILCVRDYITETGDKKFLDTVCGGRKLREILDSIIVHYIEGTPNGIKMDDSSGLIFSPAHFTWMDTNYPAGTPREGYPVEIQALWYAALVFTKRDELAAKVRESIEKYFFPAFCEGASDCLHCRRGTPAAKAEPDDHIRPNALLLITMGALGGRELALKILRSSAQLLVPGAIRTLADKPVRYPLPVTYDGRLLNDPRAPYCGAYEGPENESRKKAYHNGTAWCWPFPAYCEALYILGGRTQRRRAANLLSSGAEYFEREIPGQLSEVADGDAPHRSGGCPAQAWSVTELFRVRQILRKS